MLDNTRAWLLGQIRAAKPSFISKQPHFNFISAHYFWIVSLTILASVLMYATAGGQLAYIDALFFASGANTQAGLNTVDVNLLNTFQQICIYIFTMTSNPIVIHSSVVFLRLYWFEKRFQNMVRDARARRVTISKSRAKAHLDMNQAEMDTRYITFDPDVSDNLAPILTEIQNKIILPYYLPPHQRERVFNEKHRNSLRMNPVDIEIDGLTHRFSHLPWKEIPSTRAVFHEALRNMETTHDWSNFVRLLSGLREAKRVINTAMFVKMIRQTGAKGRVFAVIDAARQTKRTGLRFDLPQKVQEVLLFVQLKALDAAWEKKELEQALRWSTMVLEMAADPAHRLEKRRPDWLSWPVERDPLSLTAPLHLAAALAVGHNAGRDVDGRVAYWAKQVVAAWPAGKGLLEAYPAEAFGGKGSVSGDRGDVRYLSAAPLYIAPA
ncbi:hypothetical protein BN1708_016828, partial [Verticillium longisporum]